MSLPHSLKATRMKRRSVDDSSSRASSLVVPKRIRSASPDSDLSEDSPVFPDLPEEEILSQQYGEEEVGLAFALRCLSDARFV
jgi:hypothetical protein